MSARAEPPFGAARRAAFVRALGVREQAELPAVLAGFLLFLCLFAGYFMLRPVRETMGITAGVDKLQWLFSATFVTMLVAVPIYGAFSARVARVRFVPWAYAFFIVNLLAFAAGLSAYADSVWLARVFYVWLSVFNLFVVSVAWSLMADVFRPQQAKRLFAPMAAGASIGGLAGPLLGAALVPWLGHAGLAVLAAALLATSLLAVGYLVRWRGLHGAGAPAEASPGESVAATRDDPRQPIGGGMFAGVVRIVRSPYLLGISAYVILLATASTFLYIEQARLVAQTFPDKTHQTQVFGLLDAVVQGLTILTQMFVTGRIAAKHGVTWLLTGVPLLITGGLFVLAAFPLFGVLAVVMIVRRVGEYALVRPGREMLFTVVDAETKYKAKNVIDTAVYRGGDAVSAWVKSGLDALGIGAWFVALIGAALAAVWAAVGFAIGRLHESAAGEARTRPAALSETPPP